jgi:hypothetical protein
MRTDFRNPVGQNGASFHERIDYVWAIGFNDPQPTGGIT